MSLRSGRQSIHKGWIGAAGQPNRDQLYGAFADSWTQPPPTPTPYTLLIDPTGKSTATLRLRAA
ncbi:hypothetical protein [Actinokineospora inagensis]|uniref:hypothetical protein n=1 Tax=Actinokineospora inagensis TaxID=103730 RepID=UPI00047C464C|nr:hypothetical protein [Actinokineospora inagensis]